MLKQKKKFYSLYFSITISLITIKVLDLILYNKYGLGKPILYSSSKQFGYFFIKPNQKLVRRGINIFINNFVCDHQIFLMISIDSFRIWLFGDSVTYGGSIVNNEDLFVK